MSVTVLVATPIEPALAGRIAEVGDCEVLFEPGLLPPPRFPSDHDGPESYRRPARHAARWAALVQRAHVALGVGGRGPGALRGLVHGASKLRWVQGTTAGFGELVAAARLSRADARRVAFTTASGLHGRQLAEWTMLVVLAFVKDLRRLRADQEARRWQEYPVRPLAGQTMVVVGLGHVGAAIARAASGLGMRVVGVRRRPEAGAPEGVCEVHRIEALPTLAPRADAIVLAVPHCADTIGLLDRAVISALPPSSVVVNVGRGSAVDEVALIEALGHNRIAGAGLDVVAAEPLTADSPLWALDNVILSPHTASLAYDENERLVDLFCANLARFLTGRRLRNEVAVEA